MYRKTHVMDHFYYACRVDGSFGQTVDRRLAMALHTPCPTCNYKGSWGAPTIATCHYFSAHWRTHRHILALKLLQLVEEQRKAIADNKHKYDDNDGDDDDDDDNDKNRSSTDTDAQQLAKLRKERCVVCGFRPSHSVKKMYQKKTIFNKYLIFFVFSVTVIANVNISKNIELDVNCS